MTSNDPADGTVRIVDAEDVSVTESARVDGDLTISGDVAVTRAPTTDGHGAAHEGPGPAGDPAPPSGTAPGVRARGGWVVPWR